MAVEPTDLLPVAVPHQKGSGRTSVLLQNPKLIDAVVDAVRVGIPLTTALRKAGLNKVSYQDWRIAAETGKWRDGHFVRPLTLELLISFWEKITLAQAEFEEHLVRNLHEAADAINEKTNLKDPRVSEWLLTHHSTTRERWFEHRPPASHVVVEVNSAGERKRPAVRDMTEAELIELTGDEWRDLPPIEDPEENDG